MLSSLSVAGTDQHEMSKTSQQSTARQQESLDTSSTNLLETSTGVKPACRVQNKILSHKEKQTAINAGGEGKTSVFWPAPFLTSSFLASLSSLCQDWGPSSALVPGTLEACHHSACCIPWVTPPVPKWLSHSEIQSPPWRSAFNNSTFCLQEKNELNCEKTLGKA